MKRLNLFHYSFAFALILLVCGQADKPENVALSSDGVEIRFDQQGEGEPTIIFVHGWTNNRSVWGAQMAYFSQQYKVVAVDLAGYGESGYNRANWTMAAFGEDVNAVIEKINPGKVILVGFSMGGPVIVEVAKKAPENLIGLVIVDALKDVEMELTPEMMAFIDSVYMDGISNPNSEQLMAAGFYKNNPEATFKRVVAMLSAHKNTSRIGWRESLHEAHRWLNEDCIESIQQVRAPIISICSDRKPLNPEAFKKYVSSYQVKIIPDVGHLVMWDNPDEFNRLLEESIREFISESGSSAE